MTRPEPTLEEFRIMWSLRGLDPDEHDMQRLHAAWCLLHGLMQRMQPSDPNPGTGTVEAVGGQAQSVFDVSTLVNRGGS